VLDLQRKIDIVAMKRITTVAFCVIFGTSVLCATRGGEQLSKHSAADAQMQRRVALVIGNAA
jgi:hypothetical protein